jgi:tetratricopeptide (TPR) repeat protein
MAKPGRNERCPCGSGKKYKQCCLAKDEAPGRDGLAEAQAQRKQRAAERRLEAKQLKAALTAKLADVDDADGDELAEASNAVVDMVKAGRLDEAEAAARSLLGRYPQVHDGWDRLGMVHEARGNAREAADCYRRVLEFLAQHPDYTDDDGLERLYTGLIAKLDP